jgi:heat shock protein HslJ
MKLNQMLSVRLVSWTIILALSLAACTPAATQVPPINAPATEAASPQATETALPLSTDNPMPTFSPQEYATSGLGDILWQWMLLDYSNDTTLLVDDTSKYTLQFMADGTIAGTADCNNFSGSYLVQGSSLQIFIGPMTRAACQPGSFSDEYIQRLGEVRTYVFDGGDLVLNLMMDGGNMVFSKTPVAILPTPAEGMPMAVAASNVNVRSGPSTSYPVYGVMPKGRSAEVVGKNQEGTWWALKVNLVPQEQGWVNAGYVNVTGADGVPEIEAPPSRLRLNSARQMRMTLWLQPWMLFTSAAGLDSSTRLMAFPCPGRKLP